MPLAGSYLAIVNGRLSSQSTRRYKWIRFFLKRVLQYLTLAVMQTETDAARIIELGMDPARVAVSGNMKFDVGLSGDSRALVDEFRDRFGISATKPLMIAASTHAPEEEVILDALRQAKSPNLRLLLAPVTRSALTRWPLFWTAQA